MKTDKKYMKTDKKYMIHWIYSKGRCRMDPQTIKVIKEWRENMEQTMTMEFAQVAEEQYKNAPDEKKIREEIRVYWEDYFKNKKK